MRKIIHLTHACGHKVYWEETPEFALIGTLRAGDGVAAYPCPWCGGETGSLKVPQSANAIEDKDEGNGAFREFNDDGTVPLSGDEGEAMIVAHTTGPYGCNCPYPETVVLHPGNDTAH